MNDDASQSTYNGSAWQNNVYIQHGRNSFTIPADTDNTILALKKEVEEKTGVPTNEQELTYNGVEGLKFQDDKSLKYYGMMSGGFLILKQSKERNRKPFAEEGQCRP